MGGSVDEAVKQYGSMNNYIRQGLGIDEATIQALRDQLLQ
jgi:hypothetical protein